MAEGVVEQEQLAHSVTHPSNRKNKVQKGKGKEVVNRAEIHLRHAGEPAKRKVVYKSVLDSPFQVKWPIVPLNVQNTILACLIEILEESGLATFHLKRHRICKKKQKAKRKKESLEKKFLVRGAKGSSVLPESKKKRKRDAEEDDQEEVREKKKQKGEEDQIHTGEDGPGDDAGLMGDLIQLDSAEATSTITPAPQTTAKGTVTPEVSPPPPLLSHLVIGINEVTKRLEEQSRTWRSLSSNRQRQTPSADVQVSTSAEAELAVQPSLRIVMICRSDVDPPALIAHFPLLVAACNAALRPRSETIQSILLVELPKGAEHALAEAVGLRRAAVLGIDSNAPGLTDRILPLLSSIPPLVAPWLNVVESGNEGRVHKLMPTHIKQLKTSAPKDMKAAKEERMQSKAAAKTKADGKEKKKRKVAKSSIPVARSRQGKKTSRRSRSR